MNELLNNVLHRFVEGRSNLLLGVMFWGFVALTYMLAGFSPFYNPQWLPYFPGEQAIPLLPWTVWIYLSDIPLIAVGFFAFPRENPIELRKYLKTGMLIQFSAIVAFLTFPTCLPPQSQWIPVVTNDFHETVFQFVKLVDHPTNCFPSLHVAFCFFSALVHWRHSKRWFVVLLVWTLAVVVSTLTMKQHYVWDAVAGAALTFTFYGLVFHGPLTPKTQK